MRSLIPCLTLVVAGCAATPEQAATWSNWDVCRLTMTSAQGRVAEHERQRRNLDCVPLYPAILARQQQESAATDQFIRSLQRPQAPPNTRTNCRTVHQGSGVYQTVCN